MRRRHLLLASTIALLTAAPVVLGQNKPSDGFKAALAKYKTWVQRITLYKRTQGRMDFASTRDLRALDILVKSYSKPEVPRDHNKYLLATIITDAFRESIPEETLAAWRKKHRKPVDSWMWFETLDLPRMDERRDEMLEVVTGRENPYIRAAAFEALVQRVNRSNKDLELAAWAGLQLEELPKKPIERALRIEAIAALVLKKKRYVRTDWKELCRALISRTFDDDDTPRRSKIAVARYLAEAFESQNLGFDARFWMSELDRPPTAKRPKRGNTSSTGFAGIRTKGDNIVYVIDASDSMCKPISNLKKKDSGPTTGGKAKPPIGKDGRVPTADDLDWGRISNRFDAAREFLRTALATLDPEVHRFSVVLFGDEALALNATPTLVRATPKNIKRVMKELNAIEVMPGTNDRPDGVIRGSTNFHGGLRLAFRMTRSGLTKKAEYTDTKAMLEGCDTIFMLSDGSPSIDDWVASEAADPEDKAGDPESGVAQQKTPNLIYPGPYGNPGWSFLRDDVRRMNMLRRCEIHCVAIGEALQGLMDQIAKVGHGKSICIDSRLNKNNGNK